MSAEESDIVEEFEAFFPDGDPDADRVDAVLEEALQDAGVDELPKDLVRSSLPSILLALLAIRDTERNGKALLEDIERSFGYSYSPGTVYPKLHDFRDDGVLNVVERVQTKEYEFQDDSAVREYILDVAEQHLAVASFLQTAARETFDDD